MRFFWLKHRGVVNLLVTFFLVGMCVFNLMLGNFLLATMSFLCGVNILADRVMYFRDYTKLTVINSVAIVLAMIYMVVANTDSGGNAFSLATFAVIVIVESIIIFKSAMDPRNLIEIVEISYLDEQDKEQE